MKTYLFAICMACLAAVASAQINLIEDFSTDPIGTGRWSFGAGSNSHAQYSWSDAPPAFSGDSTGALSVHLDSGLSTARLQRPIGATLGQSTDFTLIVQFQFSIVQANVNEGIQMAFGLVNSGLTGGDRTGSFANFTSDDVFHTVEFNYFPNESTYNAATPGPSLTPTVFGAQKNGGDAFGNIATIFGEDADLGANASGITELPEMQTLQAELDYSALTKVLVLTLHAVGADGSLTLLDTGVPALDLDSPPGFSNYDTSFPFEVDALAIMAYQDGFTDPGMPSLIADITFERFQLIAPVPEPSSAALLFSGSLALLAWARRSRS